MKLFVTGLLFIVILFACSLPDMGCDDHSCDEGCWYIEKEHIGGIFFHLNVECPYDSACNVLLYTYMLSPKSRKNGCKMSHFEYTLINSSGQEIMYFGTRIDLPISSDDHLRFSLLDSAEVEKKYDIDLSSIIRSYTVDGDSVRITLLSKLNSFAIKCPYCPDYTNDMYMSYCSEYFAYYEFSSCVWDGDYANSTITVGLDSSWGKFYDISYWHLDSQESSFEVDARIYFRE